MAMIYKICPGSSLLGWKAYIQFITIISFHTINVQVIRHLSLYRHTVTVWLLKATKKHTEDNQSPEQVAFWFIALYINKFFCNSAYCNRTCTHIFPRWKPKKLYKSTANDIKAKFHWEILTTFFPKRPFYVRYQSIQCFI